ncbi:MAG TPA: hypothetical protein VGR67_01230 [Candidatus Polarisedimenticolia bacterium]|nr:hypothetical protein [Candidatus Polarisedimenticolia bacterium]
MLQGLIGLGALALSLLMGLWMQGVRERPVYDRPPFLLRPATRLLWDPIRWSLFAAGGILLAKASAVAAAAIGLILFGLWSWKRYLASARHRRRMIREAFARERKRDPSASDEQILGRILHAMHGSWGEELIDQIVADNPTPEAVAEMVLRMERGALPAGFHPGRIFRGR